MVRILINHLGYDSEDTKKAILQADNQEKPIGDTFTILEERTGDVVYRGRMEKPEQVARWNKGDFYAMPFSDFQPDKGHNYGHSYIIKVETTAGVVKSAPFEIYGNVLEYTTLSSVMYYFKSQRVTGEYEQIDRQLVFKGPREGVVDLHGGWNDATGDIGVHDADLVTAAVQRDGELARDHGLADAALAGHNAEHLADVAFGVRRFAQGLRRCTLSAALAAGRAIMGAFAHRSVFSFAAWCAAG
mgnify:CR=1 FL=1